MKKQATKVERRRDRRAQRVLQQQVQLRAARRRRTLLFAGGVLALGVLVVAASFILTHTVSTAAQSKSGSASTQVAPTATPVPLSPLAVDNIDCNGQEQLNYHVHAHLSLYINGQPVPVPAYIGIFDTQGCYYWLHTHDASGVIHIEAPQPGTYTLGTFIHLWSRKFSQLNYPQQLSQTTGWQVYVNGKPYTGNFYSIPLDAHTLITMAYNTPAARPDTVFNWDGL